jgi:hypothetical protein
MDQWLGTHARQGVKGERWSIYRADQDGLSPGARALMEWMEEGFCLGYQVYYLNFQFDQLPGPTNAVLQQMRTGIDRGFYGPFCRTCARHPRAPRDRHRLPETILYLDLPVFKGPTKGHGPRNGNVNDGYHYNGPMRIPPTSLFNENLIEHVEANEVRYLRHGLSQIHVTVADRSLDQLADYATKTVKRGWVDPEDILVLPRSASEGRSGGLVLGPRDRAIRDIQSSTNVSAELAEEMCKREMMPIR